MAKSTRPSDDAILEWISPNQDAARSYQSELSDERERLYKRYRAEPYGNEQQGWSQTVHPTIFDAVEWLKPGLMEVFTADFFAFKGIPKEQPQQPPMQPGANMPPQMTGMPPQPPVKDYDASAEKLKKYTRFKLFNELDGEQIVEDSIHDALTSHYCVVKVTQRDDYDVEEERIDRISNEDLALLIDGDKEIYDVSGGEEVEEFDPMYGTLWAGMENITLIRRKQKYKGFYVENVPASELYFLPGYKDLDSNPFVAHVVKRDLDYIRRQELAGVYRKGTYNKVKDKVDKSENVDAAAEYWTKFTVDGGSSPDRVDQTGAAELNNEVLVWECYQRLAIDGELLKPYIVTICEDVILREPVENPYGGPPFELGYIFKEPNKVVGRPLPAILEDRQKVLTNLLRLIQDQGAKSCYSGFLATDQQTKKQLEGWYPNAVAIVPNLNNYREVTPPSPNQFVLKAFEITQNEVAKESGVNENMQGLDNNSLNKTKGGMEMRLTAGMQRQKLYARRIARMWKRVFKRILDIIRMFPPEDDQLFIGSDVHISPEDLEGQYTVQIDVGVGPQDRMNNAMLLEQYIQWATAAGVQMGAATPEHVVRAQIAKYEYHDMDISDYCVQPEQAPGIHQMQQQMQKMQQQMQDMQGKFGQMQQRNQQMQQEIAKRDAQDKTLPIKAATAQADMQLKANKQKFDQQLDVAKLVQDTRIKQMQTARP